MPVLTILTLLSLIMEYAGSSARNMVTCSPNWNHIYTGDSVTLSCDIGPEKNINKNNIMWYKDNTEMKQQKQEFTIIQADYSDSGDYECWTGYGDRSHPLTIYVIKKDVKNRPTVTFSPNYRNIFTGEETTISCEDGSYATRGQRYVWYKNNKILENHQKYIIINKANRDDSGDYKCEGGRGASYPLRLHVHPIFDEVILQSPPNILEGDPLDLRCYSYPSYSNKEEATTFYKDGAIIQKSNQILLNVNKLTTGIYRCEKIIPSKNSTWAETFIFVQDLFTSPKVEGDSDIKEGEAMTLRCETRRNPLRKDTELTFTFYRNGETVQEPGSSDTYKVRSVQQEDSGNYTCEVRTDTVKKRSDVVYISIRELFMKPEVQIYPKIVQEGARVTIRCLQTQNLFKPLFTFYRNSQSIQNAYKVENVIPYAVEEHTGNYKCSLEYRGISKNSTEIMMQVQIAVDRPILILSPNKVAVGEDTVLQCESSKGSRPIYYLFYHDQTLLGNITVHQKEAAQLRLTITSLTLGGLYSCASYNDFQTQHQHSEEAELVVIEPITDINIITDKEREDFIMGEPLTLTCSIQRGTNISFQRGTNISVQRGTNISVLWLHNETVVENNSELYQLKDNGKVLYIDSLQYHHKGTYRCNARNDLSGNTTFSVLSGFLNVLEPSSTNGSLQWSMLGILLLMFILVVGLLLLYRKRIVPAGYCHKKPLPAGSMRDMGNVNRRNTTSAREEVYENMPSRENPEDEEEGYTYVTVRAAQAPSHCSATDKREDVTVVYAAVKNCGAVTSETNRDQRDPGTSDYTDTLDNPIYHSYSSSLKPDH